MAEELTYDPVVEGGPWQRVRPLGPLPPVAPGRALVLVPERGPAVAVRPGERGPDMPPGGYRSTVLVDITEHVLVLPLQLPCAEKDFTFRCQVTAVCSVADPAGVVARGVRDIGSMVYGPVRELLTTASASYGPTQGRLAEAALNSALTSFSCDPLVRLRESRVTLRAEATPPPAGPRTLRGEVLRRSDGAPAEGGWGAGGGAAPGGPSGSGGAAPGFTPLNGGADGVRPSRVRGTGTAGGAGSTGGPGSPGGSAGAGGGEGRKVSRVRGAGAGGAGAGRAGSGGAGSSGSSGGSRDSADSGRGGTPWATGPEGGERRREGTEGGTGTERPGGEGGPA